MVYLATMFVDLSLYQCFFVILPPLVSVSYRGVVVCFVCLSFLSPLRSLFFRWNFLPSLSSSFLYLFSANCPLSLCVLGSQSWRYITRINCHWTVPQLWTFAVDSVLNLIQLKRWTINCVTEPECVLKALISNHSMIKKWLQEWWIANCQKCIDVIIYETNVKNYWPRVPTVTYLQKPINSDIEL